MKELPVTQEIWVTCGVGQRAYYACRILTQHGYKARNLSGGFSTYRVMYPEDRPAAKQTGSIESVLQSR